MIFKNLWKSTKETFKEKSQKQEKNIVKTEIYFTITKLYKTSPSTFNYNLKSVASRIFKFSWTPGGFAVRLPSPSIKLSVRTGRVLFLQLLAAHFCTLQRTSLNTIIQLESMNIHISIKTVLIKLNSEINEGEQDWFWRLNEFEW